MSDVVLSKIDERRFGIRTARADRIVLDTLPSVMDFCRKEKVSLLIARCSASELKTAQAMESQGFLLMDTLVYYKRDLAATPIPGDDAKVLIRPVRGGEEKDVRAVAADAFRGYFGHYHADPRLDREKCDEVYTSWAFRSCLSMDAGNHVLVAEIANVIAGFATLRRNSPEEGEGVLFGIAPSAQGSGLYRSFMIQGMEWCRSKGANRMVVSTQINNIAAQKVWSRLGFEPDHACYTFHKWFDRES